jgi:hypothetical protein
MEAWADLSAHYNKHLTRIAVLTMELSFDPRSRVNDPSFVFAVELEARLQAELPEMTEALQRLRRALDKVTGWHVSWRHWSRGNIIGLTRPEQLLSDAAMSKVVRAPDEYNENEGWIVGSQVGVDSVMPGVNVWVQVSTQPNEYRGVMLAMSEMFAIKLTPPEDENY